MHPWRTHFSELDRIDPLLAWKKGFLSKGITFTRTVIPRCAFLQGLGKRKNVEAALIGREYRFRGGAKAGGGDGRNQR